MKKEVAAVLCSLASASAMAAPMIADAGMTVDLSGTADMTVANDEAFITFTSEEQATEARHAMKTVVAKANAAQKELKKFGAKITVETTDLSTWPVYRRAKEGEVQTIGAWGAKETLRVTVKDVSDVSAVMEAMLPHMNYDGVTFRVSEATQKAKSEALLRAAIQDALARATVIAEEFGLTKDNVRVEKMNAGERSGGHPRYYAAPRLNAARTAEAPQMSAGTSELNMRVSMQVRFVR